MNVAEPAVPNATEEEPRLRALASLVRNAGDSPCEGLMIEEARAVGFTHAEIEAYRDATAILA